MDHISWLCVGLTWLNPDYGWLGLLKLFHGAPRKIMLWLRPLCLDLHGTLKQILGEHFLSFFFKPSCCQKRQPQKSEINYLMKCLGQFKTNISMFELKNVSTSCFSLLFILENSISLDVGRTKHFKYVTMGKKTINILIIHLKWILLLPNRSVEVDTYDPNTNTIIRIHV